MGEGGEEKEDREKWRRKRGESRWSGIRRKNG